MIYFMLYVMLLYKISIDSVKFHGQPSWRFTPISLASANDFIFRSLYSIYLSICICWELTKNSTTIKEMMKIIIFLAQLIVEFIFHNYVYYVYIIIRSYQMFHLILTTSLNLNLMHSMMTESATLVRECMLYVCVSAHCVISWVKAKTTPILSFSQFISIYSTDELDIKLFVPFCFVKFIKKK